MNTRNIRTTYYLYGHAPSPETTIKVTQSKWADYATRNAFYALSQNKYGAGVVEIVDTGNFGELHCVLIRNIAGNINVQFKRDPMRPRLTL